MIKRVILGALFVVGAFLGAAAMVSLSSVAREDGVDASARTIPYAGFVDFQGDPHNGTVDLQFSLSGPEGYSWSETHEVVLVNHGRFAVNLGEASGEVPDWIFDTTELYIEVEIRNDDSEAWVSLDGKQRVHPDAFAYWATEADQFTADGIVDVSGTVTATGATANFGDLIVQQSFDVDGVVRPAGGEDGGIEFVWSGGGEVGASIELVEDGNGVWLDYEVSSGKSIRFEAGDHFTATGNGASLTGAITIPSNLKLDIGGEVVLADSTDMPTKLSAFSSVGNTNLKSLSESEDRIAYGHFCVLTRVELNRTAGFATCYIDNETSFGAGADSGCTAYCLF